MELIEDDKFNEQEECDILPFYCDMINEENQTSSEISSEVTSSYILTTKSLFSKNDFRKIPEVDDDLKYKILAEYFNMPYNKAQEDIQRSEDYFLKHNFKFSSYRIDDNIHEIRDEIKKYLDKTNSSLLMCIQNVPKDDYNEIIELFKKFGKVKFIKKKSR